MNVLLISQCSGNALKETRRILDQFAERRGERTWQTPITKDGLDTLRRLLRKTARKNTAVACHWIRGIDHSELMWIVGDAGRFNARGAVPTNTTRRDVLRRRDENDWHTLQLIQLLSGLAALLHDLGKACQAFQERLKIRGPLPRNLYRHEWISLRLFQAFVGDDPDDVWLNRLADLGSDDDARWLDRLQKDGLNATAPGPFEGMSPLAQAVGWLVLTHHRLPVPPIEAVFRTDILDKLPACITSEWNEEIRRETKLEEVEAYWKFQYGLPVATRAWRDKASRIARKLIESGMERHSSEWLADPYVMHLSRLSLMLADHDYSGRTDPEKRVNGENAYPLFANTDRKTGALNQPLDEHLLGVERLSRRVTRALPGIAGDLPRLARHRGLRRRSTNPRFRWQDKAAEMAEGVRARGERQGTFIVNMASTGCGKTLANARIMYALADPERGMRCAFALGLRTLTRQTGMEYRERLGLGEDEVAIRVGGAAGRELFEHFRLQAEVTGSESSQTLICEDEHVFYEGNVDDHPILARLFTDPQARSLLAAPLLACTIDHLTPATEGVRGGHQILPMLRLLSGDLVLDELDDYDIDDLPAVTRLMHWAGLLGCRVLISSATLPPGLVRGMFEAYREGRRHFQRNRGERPSELPDVCCLWVDEFSIVSRDCADVSAFVLAHGAFAEKRCDKLGRAAIRRRGDLLPLKVENRETAQIRRVFAERVLQGALHLHRTHHEIDPRSGRRVSFGLVRMANIDPLFDVALELYRLGAPEGMFIHLCVYHSQFPLLIRSAIEQRLDRALDRRQPGAVFDLSDIRGRLDRNGEADHLFIVLGSPVTEVGRDHDYDWAVVEPSSMRSLIQLAGRIRRHRPEPCEVPNLLIFDCNLKSLERPGKPAYCRPGFENADFLLRSHCLKDLLAGTEAEVIDSRPRILARRGNALRPRESLVDLEHVRLDRLMAASPRRQLSERRRRAGASQAPTLGAYTWWVQPSAMLTGILQRMQPFRKETQSQVELVLLPDEANEDYRLCYRLDPEKEHAMYVDVDKSKNQRISENAFSGPRIEAWGISDYMAALADLAGQLDMDLVQCAMRFGTVTLPKSTQGWRFHPALGFSRRTNAIWGAAFSAVKR